MKEELEIRRITEQVLKNQNLWNLAEIYKKEHNIFRGTHKGFASGGISWDAISGKPSTFPPSGHTLASHSTKAHAELTGVTSGQHHAQLHAAAHHVGGGDLVNHDSLTGFVAAEHLSLPNTIANVLSNHTKAVHDALLITTLGSGALTKDHGSAATDMLVNVCYGTGNPPTASTTTIGTLFVKYTA